MGIRSFLIKFDSIESIEKFFLWKKYLAHLVHTHFDDEWYIEKYIPVLEQGLPKNVDKYEPIDFGDFDLHLVGLKFWAGAIWGLISTQTVGQDTFALVQIILNTYYSRLWAIDTIGTDYEEIEGLFIEDYYENPDPLKAIEIFDKLYENNQDKIIDYDLVIANNQIELDKDKFIAFKTKKIFELFNINYKK